MGFAFSAVMFNDSTGMLKGSVVMLKGSVVMLWRFSRDA
jgi:hypothetical protein